MAVLCSTGAVLARALTACPPSCNPPLLVSTGFSPAFQNEGTRYHSFMILVVLPPRYYRILTMMESRFPISRAGDHIPLCFVWYDAFR